MTTGAHQKTGTGRPGDAGHPLVPVPWLIASLVFVLLAALVTGWFYLMTADLTLLLFGSLAVVVPVYFLVLYWVWKDAVAQDMQAILWVVLVVFLFILGLALYLVVRELKGLRRVH